MGSGTTAMVAKELGRYYIGCELHEDYGNLMQKRIGDSKRNIRKLLVLIIMLDKIVYNLI